jgi:hypothetical protein
VPAPSAFSAAPVAPLEVSVLGPHCEPVSDADIRRLFAGSALTQQRLDRLREWPRMLVACDETLVAAATCQRVDDELLVPDLAVCVEHGCSEHAVINALLDALENACLAGGSRRIVLSPPRASLAFLERRGYRTIKASCAGCWIEKVIG